MNLRAPRLEHLLARTVFPSRLGTEMANQINEMEYSFDDGVKQDIDMPDAEASYVLDVASLHRRYRDPCCRSRWINVAPSERHVGHAKTSRNSENPFATVIWLLVAPENEEHVQEVLEDLEGNGVLEYLRIVKYCLKLGENRSLLNNRRFPDGEGNELICKSAEHREALDLLCDVHDFQSSNEPVTAIIYFQDDNHAISHLHYAECLSSRWLAQRYGRSPSNMEQMWVDLSRRGSFAAKQVRCVCGCPCG